MFSAGCKDDFAVSASRGLKALSRLCRGAVSPSESDPGEEGDRLASALCDSTNHHPRYGQVWFREVTERVFWVLSRLLSMTCQPCPFQRCIPFFPAWFGNVQLSPPHSERSFGFTSPDPTGSLLDGLGDKEHACKRFRHPCRHEPEPVQASPVSWLDPPLLINLADECLEGIRTLIKTSIPTSGMDGTTNLE